MIGANNQVSILFMNNYMRDIVMIINEMVS